MTNEKKYTESEVELLTEVRSIKSDVKYLTKEVSQYQAIHGQEHEAIWKKVDVCAKQVEDNTKKLHGIYAIGGSITAIFTAVWAFLKYKGN